MHGQCVLSVVFMFVHAVSEVLWGIIQLGNDRNVEIGLALSLADI